MSVSSRRAMSSSDEDPDVIELPRGALVPSSHAHRSRDKFYPIQPHDPTKQIIANTVADISKEGQKDTVEMHMYVLHSATMLYRTCCILYPLMCLGLLLMASEQARDDFIRQPPAWVSTAAMYVYWHGFRAYFAVLVCSHVFMFVHGQWSTTHHAINKCTEMVNGSDKTEVGNVFWKVKTRGGVLGNFFMFVFVLGLACLGYLYYVTYVVERTTNRGFDSLQDFGTWVSSGFTFMKDKAPIPFR